MDVWCGCGWLSASPLCSHAADYSMINYFFIPEQGPPRLAALDLPDGHLDGGFGEVDEHYLPRDRHSIQVRPTGLERPAVQAEPARDGLPCRHDTGANHLLPVYRMPVTSGAFK